LYTISNPTFTQIGLSSLITIHRIIKKYTMNKFLSTIFLLGLLLINKNVHAQLTLVDSSTAEELAAYLTGEGVIVLNPVMNGTCPLLARGKFSNGLANGVGIDSGIVLTSGRVETAGGNFGINSAAANQSSFGFPPGFPYAPGDADLNVLLADAGSSSTTNDACVLEFDFIPAGDTVKFDYVFASEEYPEFACSGFNDVFGFIITGPGFTGVTNIAKVPGTNIPVAINSINMAPNGTPYNIADCNSMGTGSPFGALYVDNLGNANPNLVYDGMTTILTALAAVNPCDTFHLKIAIADAGDNSYDSGVFLKSGSLTSTALYVKTFGGGGLETPFTNTVRGCPPGAIRISRSGNLNQPITIPLTYGGTAVNGTDYTTLPPTVLIPAGDSVVTLYVNGIPVSPAVGPKSVIISIYSPYTCANNEPIVLASDTIMIYDSIYVKILNPDTAICRGRSVFLDVEADSTLDFVWTPSATVSDPTGQDVTVTPTDPTTYTVSVTLPAAGTGCLASSSSVFIDVKDTPVVDLGPDKVTCGDAVQLYAATTPLNPDETFEWTPGTSLSSTTIRNPIATPLSDMEYVVKVNPGAVGCDGYDTIKIRLLPDHITVLNNDTVVCAGTIIPLRADGDTAFSYNWDPELHIADPLSPNTTLNAQVSGYYTLTASYPGCIDMPDSFYVEVQPVPQVNIGPDKIICSYDTIQLYGAVVPASYPNYTYDWTPGLDLTDSTIQSPVFSGDASIPSLTLKVTTPLGCAGSDSMTVVVHAGDFLTVMPEDTGSCPPARIQLSAAGANTYTWSPEYGLDDINIANPVASPVSSTAYTLLGTKNYGSHICYDTQIVNVRVYPSATITLPDSVQIWPGESYQIDPGGNCLYFQWFPPSGLSADNISNPVAQPEVRTRYFVTATTEQGCIVQDSMDVLVNTESVLDAPNAFSPTTGDFKIVKRGIATLKYFRIFNRWGNKVFETTNIDKGWDGRYNDKEQPMGVYIYSIDATTNTGKVFRKDGNVTLIR
jgi:gliding motility-associated-like protein